MEYRTIKIEHIGGLLVLTLNRPDKMNALNTAMRAEITHLLQHLPEDLRALVITGAGDAFCSGQDLGDARNAHDIDIERVLRDEYMPMLTALMALEIPVLAAVNGAAAGAGANLALACDVVIAAQSAFFSQAFSRIGLMPDLGGSWVMPRKVGMARAMGAALFAERIPAPQAAQWGMIYEAVGDDSFDAHWRGRAAQLAAGPSCAFRAIKQALRASASNDLAAQLDLEAHLQGELGKSRDFLEGISAFLDKRAPNFEGR
ncbi:2-(1,2-epoxy-1,2-dihydrophenyl)acetyl-CoA isomerase [Epibacterium sp. SM1969]|uniref:2-(1,2-epoxy-1,2-dihydrophenyl)acetyl-CoA isomerase n=1 Tax=Tritonibacter aquimaris TaxID=2663379 RepID=A0A844AT51_9RHOB|nr:enoyl-CoA hydratase-related protein [Tritonibacter aquimaris]MQY41564.1 2-(1,2-epoxy-1,2-dihydrophenyl)acetyl-CoA isomerase [Tritonibacter aquimaris]